MSIVRGILAVLIALLAYVLLWPMTIDPRPWTPPALLPQSWPYNEALRAVQRIADGAGRGPEGLAIGADGRIYGGYDDGRVFALSADGTQCRVLASTGGRPLGLALDADGRIVVADAKKGLLRLDGATTTVLSTAAGDLPFGFIDDVDVSRDDGRIYFSDASHKFGYGHHIEDTLEHGANGRLLRYDPASGSTETLLKGLHFANGVALGPDEAYVLVNETSEYKVTRYWLKGDKAGSAEPFIENLPGFPDNLSYNGRDRFWIALYAPRDPLLDQLLPKPFLRKLVARLPAWVQPKPKLHAWIIGVDLQGRVIANLQYAGADAYAPITSVEEREGWLWLGSLGASAVGRIRLDEALGAPADRVVPKPLVVDCGA